MPNNFTSLGSKSSMAHYQHRLPKETVHFDICGYVSDLIQKHFFYEEARLNIMVNPLSFGGISL